MADLFPGEDKLKEHATQYNYCTEVVGDLIPIQLSDGIGGRSSGLKQLVYTYKI